MFPGTGQGGDPLFQPSNGLPRRQARARKSNVSGRSLGLIFNKTPEFIDRLEARHLQNEDECYQTIRKYKDQPNSEKLKACNFPALKLEIGRWERTARNENELIVKFYFNKKQLVWEVLDEDRVKRKIEISWDNISAIKSTFAEGKPSILHIELTEPPKFFIEIRPEPRKPTMWNAIQDFTNGEAQRCRRHTLTFAERILEKHYEKLIHSNGWLFFKSREHFPLHNSSYFDIDSRIMPTQQLVYVVPPLRQVAPVPSQPPFVSTPMPQSSPPCISSPHITNSSLIRNMDLSSKDMHYAHMSEYVATHNTGLGGMSIEPVNNIQPTNFSAELNYDQHENQGQEEPIRAYSTPAPNVYPRRVRADPQTQSFGHEQTLHDNVGSSLDGGFYPSNAGAYNLGDPNSSILTEAYNQTEAYGGNTLGNQSPPIYYYNDGRYPSAENDISLMNGGNTFGNQSPPVYYNDGRYPSADMQIDQENQHQEYV